MDYDVFYGVPADLGVRRNSNAALLVLVNPILFYVGVVATIVWQIIYVVQFIIGEAVLSILCTAFIILTMHDGNK